jgi:uncharacterized protein
VNTQTAHRPEAAPSRLHTGSSAPAAERALVFACEGEHLLGVLHPAAGTLGVVVVVGGPQVRSGSHRQFVQLARALAADGHPVLRFDVRGMGDSSGAQRSFENISPDIGAAIGALMAAQPQLRGVALWGLCDGASAALLYLHEQPDARVQGLCLLNPWARSEATQAQVQVRHYYTRRLLQPSFWRKLLGGGVGVQALRGLLGSMRTLLGVRSAAQTGAPAAALHYVGRMAAGWRAFPGPVLLQLSADDFTAREFEATLKTHAAWKGAAARANLRVQALAGADHTLSQPSARQASEQACADWLRSLDQAATPAR